MKSMPASPRPLTNLVASSVCIVLISRHRASVQVKALSRRATDAGDTISSLADVKAIFFRVALDVRSDVIATDKFPLVAFHNFVCLFWIHVKIGFHRTSLFFPAAAIRDNMQ